MSDEEEQLAFLQFLESSEELLNQELTTKGQLSPTYSPTNSPIYSPTHSSSSPVQATCPDSPTSFANIEFLKSLVFSLEKAVKALHKRLNEQERTISSLSSQHERRYKRHSTCISELQSTFYKRKRSEPVDIQQLQQLQHLLQPQAERRNETNFREQREQREYRDHRNQREAREVKETKDVRDVKEQRIKDAIGQFLKSWNQSYRCGHFVRNMCKFDESTCFKIHDEVKHALIARELRIVLQMNGEVSASAFFSKLVTNAEQNNYRYADTVSTLRQELIALSKTL